MPQGKPPANAGRQVRSPPGAWLSVMTGGLYHAGKQGVMTGGLNHAGKQGVMTGGLNHAGKQGVMTGGGNTGGPNRAGEQRPRGRSESASKPRPLQDSFAWAHTGRSTPGFRER